MYLQGAWVNHWSVRADIDDLLPCAHEILRLNLTCTHLAILGTFLDVLYQLPLLILKLGPFSIEFSLCLL